MRVGRQVGVRFFGLPRALLSGITLVACDTKGRRCDTLQTLGNGRRTKISGPQSPFRALVTEQIGESMPVPARTSGNDIVRIIVAIILPPVGVAMQVGFTTQFWINVLLTLLGYIPGIVHAVWIIARR